MSARVLILSAAVIAAGVLALILVTSQKSNGSRREPAEARAGVEPGGASPGGSASPGSRARAGQLSRAPSSSPRERPELKVAGPTADPGFAIEERDQSWAPEKEREIRDRVDSLLEQIRGSDADAVSVARVECKSERCRLRIAGGDSKRFMQFVEALQGSDGFYGQASQLMLHGYVPAEQPGDRASVTVILVYDRDDQ